MIVCGLFGELDLLLFDELFSVVDVIMWMCL